MAGCLVCQGLLDGVTFSSLVVPLGRNFGFMNNDNRGNEARLVRGGLVIGFRGLLVFDHCIWIFFFPFFRFRSET